MRVPWPSSCSRWLHAWGSRSFFALPLHLRLLRAAPFPAQLHLAGDHRLPAVADVDVLHDNGLFPAAADLAMVSMPCW